MKVVLERSPLVKDKLLERATQQIDLAKRNLDFNSSGKPDRNVRLLASSSRSLNQGSRTRGGKEGAAIRSDSGSETTGTQPQNDAEGSSGHSWLDPTRFLCLIFFVTSYMFLSIPLVSNLFVQSFFLRIFRNFRKGTVTVVLLFIAITFLVKQTEREDPAKEFRGYLLYIAPKLENIGEFFSSFSPFQSSLI